MLTANNKINKYFVAKNEFSSFGLVDDLDSCFHDSGYNFGTSLNSGNPNVSLNFNVYNVGKSEVFSNSSFTCDIQEDSYNNTVVWDLFGTNNLYVNDHTFKLFGSANNVLPCLYFTNVISNGSLSNYDAPVGKQILVELPDGDSILFVRHIGTWSETSKANGAPVNSGYINGWATYYEHFFHKNILDLGDLANELGLIADKLGSVPELEDSMFKITKSLSAISKNKPKSNFDAFMNSQPSFASFNKSFSDFLNSHLTTTDDIKKEDKDIMSSSCSLCAHYTIDSPFASVTANSYPFANVPKNIPICSHPQRIDSEKVVYCSYSPQNECSVYVSTEKVLKYYNTQGPDSVSFKAVKTINSSGNVEVFIYNVANSQVSYSLSPPAGISDEDMIIELDEIVKEVLSHWSPEVNQTLEVSLPIADSVDQSVDKKTFFLSLV